MDVTIIGAGIIGQTIALRLMQAGHAVRIVAPLAAPTMASTGNAGTIASYAVDPVGTPGVLRDTPRLLLNSNSPLTLHRPSALSLIPWLFRFLRQSLPRAAQRNRVALAALLQGVKDDWTDLAASVGGTAHVRERGTIYAYDTPAAIRAVQVGLERRRSLGVGIQALDPVALRQLEPGLPKGRFAGGVLFTGALWLDDPAAMLDRITRTHGAERIDARVTALVPKGSGWTMQLDTNQTLNAQAVVVAAGAWSARLLRPLGLHIPLTAERGYHLEFDMPEAEHLVTRPVCPVSHGFYFTPLAGRLRAAGTVELGGIDAPPSPHRWMMLERGVRSVFPALPPVSRRWMGLRPSIPDSLPVIGTAQPGLVLAFGHGHIGLTLAPGTAALVIDALNGAAPSPAVHRRRFEKLKLLHFHLAAKYSGGEFGAAKEGATPPAPSQK